MIKYEIKVSDDKNSLAHTASDLIAHIIESTLKIKRKAKIALCGGSTPKAAYSLLGKKNLEWINVDLFLGDERWVDTESPDSNCFLLNNSLFKEGNPSLEASFFRVSTVDLASPEKSALSPFHIDWWTCIPEPLSPLTGFGINVAVFPKE